MTARFKPQRINFIPEELYILEFLLKVIRYLLVVVTAEHGSANSLTDLQRKKISE